MIEPLTIEEFKEFYLNPKDLFHAKELVLHLKHKEYRNIFLRIWISSIAPTILNNGIYSKYHNDAPPYGVFIRIDHTKQSSCPLSKDNVYSLMFKETRKILEFYEFGKTKIDDLPKILEIVKHLKPATLPLW